MKIKLLTYLEEKNNLYLNSTVLLKTPQKRTTTKFILDTGSPETIINYTDALRLNIPFNTKGKIIRLGSKKFQGYEYSRLIFVFLTEDGNKVEEDMKVTVLRPTGFAEIDEVDAFPTILGMDFLKERGYKLFCDVSKDIAYLEK